MRTRIYGFLVAGLMASAVSDRSGQDAYPCGLKAQYAAGTGRFAEALKLYQHAYQLADASSSNLQRYFLNNIGACQLALFHYNDAERTLVEVRGLADAAHDDQTLGGADGNLAAVYVQLNDFPAAEMYARESLQAYSRAGKPQQRARAMLTLAEILSRPKLSEEGEQFFRAGIDAADNQKDWPLASTGWLHYGSVLLDAGRLDAADRAFQQSDHLFRRSGRAKGEYALLFNQSRLHLLRKDYRGALQLITSAIRLSPPSGGRITSRRMYQTRAEIELAGGEDLAALRDARVALQSARTLRANTTPDSDNRVGIDGVVDETFSVLIDAGNRVYRKTGDPNLIRETFEAAEENRAESLEKVLPVASNWRTGPATAEYQSKFSQLLREQRVLVRLNSAEAQERVARLQTELAQMETYSDSTIRSEAGTILDRVRRHLPAGAALLSFHLDDRESWLWSVDRDTLHLYRLPSKAVLLADIHEFQAAIGDNDSRRIATMGRRVYRELLGMPENSFASSTQWYISLDESLYSLSFPALVVEMKNGGPVFLTERKTLQFLPGAQVFATPVRRSFANGRFVLAGDGVYNRADPRFGGPGLIRLASWGMARLLGSGAEVRFAAELSRNAVLLTGPWLTKDRLLREIDRDPDVIHIASHVLEAQDRWHSGILALGVDRAGEPDLLTPREIQLHPLHARLVVMTGCSSGSSEAPPASGLMGLTRAWLTAGAGDVLATRLPTRDESSDGLIGSFYLHLLASPQGNIPEALREARLDMIARGGWRAEPRYWSSFFLIGVR